jgi:hypothetical protein
MANFLTCLVAEPNASMDLGNPEFRANILDSILTIFQTRRWKHRKFKFKLPA